MINSERTAAKAAVLEHLLRYGHISTVEAMISLGGMSGGTLTKSICRLQDEGYTIKKIRKVNSMTGRQYTTYRLVRA